MEKKLERYPGQADDETTQCVISKHWVSVAPIIFVAFVMFALSLLGIYYGASHTGNIYGSVPASDVSIYGFVGVMITIWFFIAAIWVWRHNRIVVTNEHLVDISQNGLFGHRISILNLGTIQDMSTQVNGPLQSILKYGTIIVQTAGERENFVLNYVPNPYDNEQTIHQAHTDYRHKETTTNSQPKPNPLEG